MARSIPSRFPMMPLSRKCHNITTQYAQKGGLLLVRDVEAGQSVPRGKLLLLRIKPATGDALTANSEAGAGGISVQHSGGKISQSAVANIAVRSAKRWTAHMGFAR